MGRQEKPKTCPHCGAEGGENKCQECGKCANCGEETCEGCGKENEGESEEE